MVATPMSLVQNIGFVFIQLGEDASSKRTNVRAHHWSRSCGLGGRVAVYFLAARDSLALAIQKFRL